MNHPLPSNEMLVELSSAIPWGEIERQKRQFYEAIQALKANGKADTDSLPLEDISDAIGAPVSLYYDSSAKGNLILGHVNGRTHILGSFVSQRYRKHKSLLDSIVLYNMNPSVNHTNIHETDTPTVQMRALGAEVELGLLHPDGRGPDETEVQAYIELYKLHAHKLGITPQVDREACQYQVEAHVAPGVGYHRTRHALDGIMTSLVRASETTGLQTAVLAAYPIESDFKLTDDPKVHTAVDLMLEVNGMFPEYQQRLRDAQARYHIGDCNFVEMFRIQGCHIHLDLGGRSEALGLLTFYTMLRSATAIANSALLKGAPFVNGTSDPELLCVREHLRRTTVTGRYIEVPTMPHISPTGMDDYGDLIRSERANAVGRAHLFEKGLGEILSVMHNPIGRVRPDLSPRKRICTLESTGMPVNVSASRMAAVLTDFEFSHVLIEAYFRKYGCDLEPMMQDRVLWSILGPLSSIDYEHQQDTSDRIGTDLTLKTATGEELSLAEFYETKRLYMHRNLVEMAQVSPRDIDDVYSSLNRMLAPPSGRSAETIEQYICDPMLRSTGNWGRILQSAFEEEGGTRGSHNPEAVLAVTNRVHAALRKRYL